MPQDHTAQVAPLVRADHIASVNILPNILSVKNSKLRWWCGPRAVSEQGLAPSERYYHHRHGREWTTDQQHCGLRQAAGCRAIDEHDNGRIPLGVNTYGGELATLPLPLDIQGVARRWRAGTVF